ncbi:MAG TPA: hypothetical protein VHM89_04595 [Acidimicrobiales bacterium]|nr:hypothetical protein [Acidimicrobiales bacterium]
MSGWIVASVLGGVFALVVIVVLVMVSKAVMRTARNASELMLALEQVQAQTSVLADFQAQSDHTARVVDDATSVLRSLEASGQVAEHEGNGRDGGR